MTTGPILPLLSVRKAKSSTTIATARRQRVIIYDHFEGLGWKVPAALNLMGTDDDFYFDRINQIGCRHGRKDGSRWWGTRGIACLRSQAWAARWRSSAQDGLRKHRGGTAPTTPPAFQEYHDKLHAFVDDVQKRAATEGMAMIFPASEVEISERDRKLRDGEPKA